MISRRGFLSAIAAAFVADPERALWVPGKKSISIARPRIIRPDPVEVAYTAVTMKRYTNERFGLSINITRETLLADDEIELRVGRQLKKAMDELSREHELKAWTFNRTVSVDRQAIQRRSYAGDWLPAGRLPK